MSRFPVARRNVIVDHDRPQRAVRVSAHPEAGLVVLSIWDGSRCCSTLRLDPSDVPDVVAALTAAAVRSKVHAVGAA